MSSRRGFLKSASGAVAACAVGGTLASLLESCGSIKFVSAAEKDGKLAVSRTDFAGQFVVVKTAAIPFPVYLSKSSGTAENYTALLMRCTHKHCEVKPAGNVLLCPCHYSEFSAAGKVLKGPASTDLEKFTVSHDSQNIYIHLR